MKLPTASNKDVRQTLPTWDWAQWKDFEQGNLAEDRIADYESEAFF